MIEYDDVFIRMFFVNLFTLIDLLMYILHERIVMRSVRSITIAIFFVLI